jgi:hypothetical protein
MSGVQGKDSKDDARAKNQSTQSPSSARLSSDFFFKAAARRTVS